MTLLWALPGSWRWAAFGDVASVETNAVSPADYPASPHIAPNHIESGTGRLLAYTTTFEDGVISPKHHFHCGHILYSKIRPYLAKAVLVDFDGLCSADMYPVASRIDARYLHQWLISRPFTEAASQNQGRTVLPKINQKALDTLPVPVPPLREQLRIAARLHDLRDRSRRAHEALDAIPPILAKFRQSVLAAAFRGDLTADWRAAHPDVQPASNLLAQIRQDRRECWEASGPLHRRPNYVEPTIPVPAADCKLPPSWEWATLELLTDPIRLIRYGILMPGPDCEGGPKYVKVLHMRGDRIDVRDLPRTSPEMFSQFAGSALAKGDLLLSIRGTYGRVALVPDELDGANITQDSARIAPNEGVDREYLANILRSPQVQAYFRSIAKGVAVKGINIRDVRPTLIPLPPYEEQLQVVKRVAFETGCLQTLTQRIVDCGHLLSTLNSSILAKAFRGELVPQEPNDEPASVLLERIRAERAASANQAASQKGAGRRRRERSTNSCT